MSTVDDMKRKDRTLEGWLSRNTVSVLVGVAIGAFLFALILAGLYVFVFRAPPASVDAATMGQVGDFFGGLLNPVFSFLSMLALLVALVLQGRELRMSRKELKLSRKEMRKSAEALESQNAAIERQQFEQTFFAWFGTYQTLLGEISTKAATQHGAIDTNVHWMTGRPALKDLWDKRLTLFKICIEIKELTDDPTWKQAYHSATGVDEGLFEGWSEGVEVSVYRRDPPPLYCPGILAFYQERPGGNSLVTQAAFSSWEKLYRTEEYQLDSLFRGLYRLIQWIDEIPDANFQDNKLRWHYVGIIRSQLSWIEMVFLFYNGLSERGGKFRRLVEKYALFDNLRTESDDILHHLRSHPPAGVSTYADAAFQSAVARAALGIAEVGRTDPSASAT